MFHALTISRIDCAVRQGTVDFSTTILSSVATFAMLRVAASTKPMSSAIPLPIPFALVGVLTHTYRSLAFIEVACRRIHRDLKT